MTLQEEITYLLSRRPLVIATFDSSFSAGLFDSRNGLDRFTLTQQHTVAEGIKTPTLCLAELRLRDDETACYVGVLTHKAPVSTFDTRLTFSRLRRVSIGSLNELAQKLHRPGFERRFRERIEGTMIATMSEQLGIAVMGAIAEQNDSIVQAALGDLPNRKPLRGAAWEQKDAIHLAQTIFGLSAADVTNEDGQEEFDADFGAHLLEDNVIAKDASEIPGFSAIKKHLTGRSEFSKGDERLTIYTANRGPLEKMLGVDLVYVNEVVGNIVMVQYKMLERTEGTPADWIFRPDNQLDEEVKRMVMPELGENEFEDYRIHRSPFFFKFVKRKLEANSEQQAFVISLPHLEKIMADPKLRGPKDGVRVSYDSLSGNYLRQTDLIGLIRSGYVGTHRIESKVIQPFLDAVQRGDRAMVLAWQRKIVSPANPPS